MKQNSRDHCTIVLSSARDRPLTVHFEPAGGSRELAQGETFRIDVSGPRGETIEIMHQPDSVTVWPSPALVVSVFDHAGNVMPILGY